MELSHKRFRASCSIHTVPAPVAPSYVFVGRVYAFLAHFNSYWDVQGGKMATKDTKDWNRDLVYLAQNTAMFQFQTLFDRNRSHTTPNWASEHQHAAEK